MNSHLQTYHDLLLQWQKTINLIAPGTVEQAWDRHFEDSLQLLPHIPDEAKTVVDLGSGAGFPGLVIGLERPDMQVHLVESDTRKCAFLRNVSRETSATNITIHNARIDDVTDDIDADVVTARALASLQQLINYTKPLWIQNKNLKMLLPKGKSWRDEITTAQKHYIFETDNFPSETSKEARILIVGNIAEK